jgi:hypothetical protein
VQRHRDDADADRHGHGGERQPDAQRRSHRRPAGRQATLDEDQHERGEAERLGQPGVGERDAEHRLAQQYPDAQVQQQRREADTGRGPDGEHSDEHDGGRDPESRRQARHATSRSARNCIGAGETAFTQSR